MIKPEDIAKVGGDWAGYGELSGQALLDLIQQGKISMVFADQAVQIAVQRADGTSGTYNLKHTDINAF